MRTAAIVIDEFLSEEKWEYISNIILDSDYLKSQDFKEWRDPFYEKVIDWIEEKSKSIEIWRPHWGHTIPMWSYMNSLPPNIDRESSGGGYHKDFGGFVYYIHPTWDPSWGGHLKFKDCDVDKIEPKPNRFVWINPAIWHGIEVVNSNALHNRITVVGWPEGCVEYESASLKINMIMDEVN
jgi:hypothetical protein